MRLVYLGGAWLFGLAAAAHAELPLPILVAIFPLAIIVYFLWHPNRRVLLIAVCLTLAVLAMIRYQHASAVTSQKGANPLVDRFTTRVITGTVTSDPVTVDQTTSFSLRVQEVATGVETTTWPATIIVVTRGSGEIEYGDSLRVEGKLSSSAPTDAQDRLSKQGISAVMYYGKIYPLDRGGGWPLLGGIYNIRHSLAKSLSNSLPASEASLAAGLLIGGYSNMPSSVKEDFRRAGLLHLVAVSGFNMTLVAGLVLSLGTGWFGRRKATFLAAGAIVLFTIFWGLQASVLRAAIMSGLALLAVQVGRRHDGLNALTLAAMLMSAFDPFILEDVGFQLSFASTAGIILISPLLSGLLAQGWRGASSALDWQTGDEWVLSITESIAVTTGALAATIPITALNFQNVSLIAPLANLAVLPAVPLGMFMAAGQAFSGVVLPDAAHFATPITWAVQHYIVMVADLAASLPFASVNVGKFETPAAALGYGLVAVTVWRMYEWHREAETASTVSSWPSGIFQASGSATMPVRWLPLCGTILLFAVPWSQFGAPQGLDRMYFLDVGQGDSILIRTAAGRSVLIDGGPSPARLRHELDSRLPFWERRLDLVIATHEHTDHIGGLPAVLQHYPVGQVIDSGFECENESCTAWRRLISEKRIPYTIASAGHTVPLDNGVKLEVLYPDGSRSQRKDGGNSPCLVLRFVSGRTGVLLTSDVDILGQTEMVVGGNQLESQVLKLPHHGAKESLSPNFLDVVKPEAVLVSVGANNLFGHPAPETMEMLSGALILRTDQHGTIEIVTNGKEYWIQTSH